LLGELFRRFVGKTEDNGTVRRDENHVVCITGDVVFAEASKAWLEALANEGGGKLVIWAVTTLLPTEFAFPGSYWGTNEDSVGHRRVTALEDFVAEVIRQCKLDHVAKYRRVTVFHGKNRELFKKLKTNRKNGSCRLDNWFVLDGRISQQNFESAANSIRVLENQMGWNFLSKPRVPPDKNVSGDGGRDGVFRYYELGGAPEVFYHIVPANNRDQMYVLGLTPERLVQPMRSNGRPTLNDRIASTGCVNLRDWYCKHLHKGNGADGADAAWWTVLNDDAHELIKPFLLNYNGFSVPTFDLLMIGSIDTDGDSMKLEKPTWHGAAISNLSFDRTECTIQLVIGKDALNGIAESVKHFCNGFGLNGEAETVKGVASFGPWRTWPVGTNLTEEENEVTTA
jgi:hypothetical protein